METLLSACEQLLTSKLFDEFLAYFKAITNLINSHNSKGTTEGISLSCLSQVTFLFVKSFNIIRNIIVV